MEKGIVMSIKDQLEQEIHEIGKRHINSKITDLLNLSVDLCYATEIKTKNEVVDFINEIVLICQEVLKERYL